jgi:hypothetical protein
MPVCKPKCSYCFRKLIVCMICVIRNGFISVSSNIQATQRLVRSDLSELAALGTYIWMNLW